MKRKALVVIGIVFSVFIVGGIIYAFARIIYEMAASGDYYSETKVNPEYTGLIPSVYSKELTPFGNDVCKSRSSFEQFEFAKIYALVVTRLDSIENISLVSRVVEENSEVNVLNIVYNINNEGDYDWRIELRTRHLRRIYF